MKQKNKRKVLSAVLAVLLALVLVGSVLYPLISMVSAQAVSASELEQLRRQAEELAAQKKAKSNEIAELRDQRASIVAQKNKLDERISITMLQIDNLNAQIAVLEDNIAEKEAEYQARLDEEAAQKELFRGRVREMEENGEISYISIVFEASSFSDLLSRIDSVTDIMNYDEWVVKQLEASQAVTLRAKTAFEAGKTEAEISKAELDDKKRQFEEELEEANRLIAEVEEDMYGRQAEYDELEALEEEAAKEIDNMVAELERLERERRSKEASILATGNYMWPSKDSVYVTSLYGNRLHPVYGYYKWHSGVDIGASYGTNIYAADGGSVVTSQYSSSYGNYVMIDHGGGNYTLYAHMSQRLVSVGDAVTKGSVIGLVGSTGVSTGPHIHFEIYQNGERVNPLDFFSNYVIVGW